MSHYAENEIVWCNVFVELKFVKSLFLHIHISYEVCTCGAYSWLRHCITRQGVAGLIPDGVAGNFRPHFVALESTQPLT